MASIGNKRHTQEYVYDFDVDGGTFGTPIVLSAKAGSPVIPVGAVVMGVMAKVLTTLAGASATLSWGNTDDPDGYSGVTAAVGGFTADAVFNGDDNAAALLWDDTNDHKLYVNVADASAGAFEFLIDTASLTAGKMVFMVDFYLPGAEV